VNALSIVALLFAGGLSGFLAGFFGVGGGIILVPILLYLFSSVLQVPSEVATHLTFGTSLFVVIFASLVSAIQYSKNKHVIRRAVVFMGGASIAGAFIGSAIAASLSGIALQQIFAVIVVIAAIRMLTESQQKGEVDPPILHPAGLMGIGVVVGLISSLAGVGGGFFSIPMMYYLMRFPLKKALGTSSASIVITAFASLIGYVVAGWDNALLSGFPGTLGYVDYLHAIPIILGSLPMAKLGASFSHRTDVTRQKKYFAIFLLAVAVKMLFL